jgi:hypothetical protein
VSIKPTTCYIVACGECRKPFEDDDGEIHFDSPEYAVQYISGYGWVLAESGDPICERCVITAICRRDGHRYCDWTPCACHGAIPDHTLFGCGLFRICWRDGCEHYETRTLAQLPTTQEPTIPGC